MIYLGKIKHANYPWLNYWINDFHHHLMGCEYCLSYLKKPYTNSTKTGIDIYKE